LKTEQSPRSKWLRWADRGLGALVWVTFALVLAAWGMLVFLADRWWPATVLLFAPRWVLAAPLGPLALLALIRRRRLLLPLAAAAAIVFGPVMGLCVPNPLRSEPTAPRVRVLTQNLGKVPLASGAVRTLMAEVKPDIAAFQECAAPEDGASPVPGYNLHVDRDLCLLSRFPILKADPRDRQDVWQKGGSGAMALYTIEGPAGIFYFMNVHLETVRDGIGAVLGKKLGGVPELEANIAARRWESELARDWIGRVSGALLVAGDFNMPVESGIYRDLWSHYTNAFSDAGTGYGFTKQTRLLGVRIDHVLAGPGWAVERAWVARPIGSDHDGVIADLRRETAH
jgi:endonuclease/exonuclease/phosphatase (EEP) superfamily protein YafD